jgi:hypothetical protein
MQDCRFRLNSSTQDLGPLSELCFEQGFFCPSETARPPGERPHGRQKGTEQGARRQVEGLADKGGVGFERPDGQLLTLLFGS